MAGRVVENVLSIAAALAVFAVSGNASTVTTLGFTTTTTGGSWAITNPSGSISGGQSYTLSGMANVIFSGLTVSNDPTTADNGTYALSSSGCNGTGGNPSGGTSSGAILDLTSSAGGNITLTLYGAVTSLSGIATGCNVLGTLTGAFTGTDITSGNGGSGQFAFAGLAVNGLFANSTLLSDLALSSYQPTSLAGGSAINGGSGVVTTNSGATTDTFTATSEQFTMNVTSTPEPFSCALLGGGLIIVGLSARRRRPDEASPVETK